MASHNRPIPCRAAEPRHPLTQVLDTVEELKQEKVEAAEEAEDVLSWMWCLIWAPTIEVPRFRVTGGMPPNPTLATLTTLTGIVCARRVEEFNTWRLRKALPTPQCLSKLFLFVQCLGRCIKPCIRSRSRLLERMTGHWRITGWSLLGHPHAPGARSAVAVPSGAGPATRRTRGRRRGGLRWEAERVGCGTPGIKAEESKRKHAIGMN